MVGESTVVLLWTADIVTVDAHVAVAALAAVWFLFAVHRQ